MNAAEAFGHATIRYLTDLIEWEDHFIHYSKEGLEEWEAMEMAGDLPEPPAGYEVLFADFHQHEAKRMLKLLQKGSS